MKWAMASCEGKGRREQKIHHISENDGQKSLEEIGGHQWFRHRIAASGISKSSRNRAMVKGFPEDHRLGPSDAWAAPAILSVLSPFAGLRRR